jgi:VIT1/CCC1 family predicted Fe2+/Mn2+ transporter
MNILEYRIFPMFLIFIFGLLSVIAGIKTIITKSFFAVSRHTDPRFWHTPKLIKGKEAISMGINYIVGGILFMLPFIAICLGWTNAYSKP